MALAALSTAGSFEHPELLVLRAAAAVVPSHGVIDTKVGVPATVPFPQAEEKIVFLDNDVLLLL